ncbi:Zn-ribbon domain-containing OB-fold protein [Gordonia rubripertincta]|uniref:Zinc ribbon domain-containing protein n=1 Tax=Gordonia rubripertincta TaxID=36822 RepID=A0ABT4MNM2_GORRU|nr:zinc ribbon domain-containing protein [Gordonia rubripertincta]MCZ4548594.1 zinc ribbon domain-containing protein [Gordonia rubripertincta]
MTTAFGDRDSREWWEALGRRELLVQQCDDCGTPRWAPRAVCNQCGSFNWKWVQTNRQGRVIGWTVSHRSFIPGLEAPYTVVLVRLDHGENLMIPGGWAGDPAGSDLAAELSVVAEFTENTDSDGPPTVLMWRRATPVTT